MCHSTIKERKQISGHCYTSTNPLAAKCISLYTSNLIYSTIHHFPANYSSKHRKKDCLEIFMCTQTPSAVLISTYSYQKGVTYLRQVIFDSFIVKARYNVNGKKQECAIRIYVRYCN